ncbi:MAG: cell division protein FtsQ [Bacillota bacterium]|jgi:cell division protein FtsQ|nr:cell division protein FtsQ [Bacillota bacterium]MDK2855034.1 cell division protein FtsQ [Bacillota bacterium]MDK2924844.1 cell division protein FtsQ [Bacillota bacterium]
MLSRRAFRILLLAFVLLMGAAAGLMRSPYFAVRSVEVVGTRQVKSEEIQALTGIKPGVNIISLRADEVARAVAGHPWIKSIQLIRHLPGRVVLKVEERRPLFLVPYRTSFLEVAGDGVILAVRPDLTGQALPLITGLNIEREVRLGQRLPGEVVQDISRCLQGLPADFLAKVAEIHRDAAGEFTLYTLSGQQILLGRPVDLDRKLALVNGTLAELRAQGQVAATIDVRNGTEAVVRLKR